jgi:hypothetical protein
MKPIHEINVPVGSHSHAEEPVLLLGCVCGDCDWRERAQALLSHIEHLRDTRDDRDRPLADVVRSVATDERLHLGFHDLLSAEELAEGLRGKLLDWLSALNLRDESRDLWRERALKAESALAEQQPPWGEPGVVPTEPCAADVQTRDLPENTRAPERACSRSLKGGDSSYDHIR